jgi:regulator of replication initiation timing
MPAITFQSVDNEYEWGTYFDLKVLIMSRNGYINATKMCQDNGKRLDNWMQNSWSKDYIEDFNSHPYIPGTPSIIVVNSGSNDTRGTYVHLELITYIAAWISIKIARKVSRIVIEYRLKEQKLLNNKLVSDNSKKDDKISELEAKLDSILKNTNNLDKKVTDLTDEISKLSLDNQITHEKLDGVQNTLNVVVEDRVVKPNNKGMTNTVIIYEYESNKFRIFRVQKRSANTSVKRYLSMNPNAVRFAEIDYNPNSVNYFIRFKEQLKDNIKWNYNRFELFNITKDQLKEFIMKINEEKYELEETF